MPPAREASTALPRPIASMTERDKPSLYDG